MFNHHFFDGEVRMIPFSVEEYIQSFLLQSSIVETFALLAETLALISNPVEIGREIAP